MSKQNRSFCLRSGSTSTVPFNPSCHIKSEDSPNLVNIYNRHQKQARHASSRFDFSRASCNSVASASAARTRRRSGDFDSDPADPVRKSEVRKSKLRVKKEESRKKSGTTSEEELYLG